MNLYYTMPLEVFCNAWVRSGNSFIFKPDAINLMHVIPSDDYLYGLSLLRKAIGLYEKKKGVDSSVSKSEMPFFREKQQKLIGPEMEFYVICLSEDPTIPFSFQNSDVPLITLTLDYDELASHCIFENMFLIRCKQDETAVIDSFINQLEKEYDKFFYDEEHSGFTADSHFFSMLCNAVLEIKQPSSAFQKEWRLALMMPPEDVQYRYEHGKLIPYYPISFPMECIRQVKLEDLSSTPLLYGALAGFLKSKGLPPEMYLDGMQD